MASVMASQAIFFPTSTPIKPNSKFKPFFSPTPTLKFNPKSNPNPIPKLSLRPICATLTTNPQTPTPQNPSQPPSPLTHLPTRTITTLFALTVAAVRSLSISVVKFGSQFGPSIGFAAGPLFFAALRDRPSGNLNTPLTVVAAGLSKWLDIYSGVLMVRVLLSWFPNIPWDRQPLSAIRDLCDPYLNLFRNIIPPIFDTLDVSPLLAFAVLGTLGSILNNSR